MNAHKYINDIVKTIVNKPFLSILFLLSVFSFIYLEIIYRPFILKLGIYDFYFSNTYPNIFGLYIATFGSLLVYPTNFAIRRALLITIGFVIYEVMQIFIPYATFDYMDIAASIFSFVIFTCTTITARWLNSN